MPSFSVAGWPNAQVMDLLQRRKRRGLPNPFAHNSTNLPSRQWYSNFFARHGIAWRAPAMMTSQYKEAARDVIALRAWTDKYEQVCLPTQPLMTTPPAMCMNAGRHRMVQHAHMSQMPAAAHRRCLTRRACASRGGR
jgi:hypothetical protein